MVRRGLSSEQAQTSWLSVQHACMMWLDGGQRHRTGIVRVGSDTVGEGCSISYLEILGVAVLIRKIEVEEKEFQTTSSNEFLHSVRAFFVTEFFSRGAKFLFDSVPC